MHKAIITCLLLLGSFACFSQGSDNLPTDTIHKALIAGKTGGDIQRHVLAAQKGLIVSHEKQDFDIRHVVTSYTMSITRNGSAMYKQEVKGPRLDDVMEVINEEVRTGDMVSFYNIRCVGRTKSAKLLPLTFRIVK